MLPPARRRRGIAENRPRGRGWARRPKCHVACWHETDLPTGADDVCCWGATESRRGPIKPTLTTRADALHVLLCFEAGEAKIAVAGAASQRLGSFQTNAT